MRDLLPSVVNAQPNSRLERAGVQASAATERSQLPAAQPDVRRLQISRPGH